MFYVITCFDRSLRRVVTTKDQAIDLLKELNLSSCIVSRYDSPESLRYQKIAELLDEFYLSVRKKTPERLDALYDCYGECLIHLIQMFLASGDLEMDLHAKGPGAVVAVQLEDDEG